MIHKSAKVGQRFLRCGLQIFIAGFATVQESIRRGIVVLTRGASPRLRRTGGARSHDGAAAWYERMAPPIHQCPKLTQDARWKAGKRPAGGKASRLARLEADSTLADRLWQDSHPQLRAGDAQWKKSSDATFDSCWVRTFVHPGFTYRSAR